MITQHGTPSGTPLKLASCLENENGIPLWNPKTRGAAAAGRCGRLIINGTHASSFCFESHRACSPPRNNIPKEKISASPSYAVNPVNHSYNATETEPNRETRKKRGLSHCKNKITKQFAPLKLCLARSALTGRQQLN